MFDFLCPLWFGRLTNQAQCNEAEVKEKKLKLPFGCAQGADFDKTMKVSYMYILKCSDGTYYTGSTKDLRHRMLQHQNGEGANYTHKRLPVELVYFEEFSRIDDSY